MACCTVGETDECGPEERGTYGRGVDSSGCYGFHPATIMLAYDALEVPENENDGAQSTPADNSYGSADVGRPHSIARAPRSWRKYSHTSYRDRPRDSPHAAASEGGEMRRTARITERDRDIPWSMEQASPTASDTVTVRVLGFDPCNGGVENNGICSSAFRSGMYRSQRQSSSPCQKCEAVRYGLGKMLQVLEEILEVSSTLCVSSSSGQIAAALVRMPFAALCSKHGTIEGEQSQHSPRHRGGDSSRTGPPTEIEVDRLGRRRELEQANEGFEGVFVSGENIHHRDEAAGVLSDGHSGLASRSWHPNRMQHDAVNDNDIITTRSSGSMIASTKSSGPVDRQDVDDYAQANTGYAPGRGIGSSPSRAYGRSSSPLEAIPLLPSDYQVQSPRHESQGPQSSQQEHRQVQEANNAGSREDATLGEMQTYGDSSAGHGSREVLMSSQENDLLGEIMDMIKRLPRLLHQPMDTPSDATSAGKDDTDTVITVIDNTGAKSSDFSGWDSNMMSLLKGWKATTEALDRSDRELKCYRDIESQASNAFLGALEVTMATFRGQVLIMNGRNAEWLASKVRRCQQAPDAAVKLFKGAHLAVKRVVVLSFARSTTPKRRNSLRVIEPQASESVLQALHHAPGGAGGAYRLSGFNDIEPKGVSVPCYHKNSLLRLACCEYRLGANGRAGSRWQIKEQNLRSIEKHKLGGLLDSMRLLVVAFDNMREEDRLQSAAVSEIVNNRDWLLRIAMICIAAERRSMARATLIRGGSSFYGMPSTRREESISNATPPPFLMFKSNSAGDAWISSSSRSLHNLSVSFGRTDVGASAAERGFGQRTSLDVLGTGSGILEGDWRHVSSAEAERREDAPPQMTPRTTPSTPFSATNTPTPSPVDGEGDTWATASSCSAFSLAPNVPAISQQEQHNRQCRQQHESAVGAMMGDLGRRSAETVDRPSMQRMGRTSVDLGGSTFPSNDQRPAVPSGLGPDEYWQETANNKEERRDEYARRRGRGWTR